MEKEDKPVEINDLNKTQLILLAILLSFVVSIATGIVTATLLQQAPPAVTQTINRVVQQTIEKVAPDYTPGKTQTVVVKEDELVVDAVSKTRANLYKIFETTDAKDSLNEAYSVGDGIFVSKYDGLDKTKTYFVKDGDVSVPLKIISAPINGLVVLTTDTSDKTAKDFSKSSFGKDSDVKAGQTTIAISGDYINKDTVQNISEKTTKDKDGNVIDKWVQVLLGNQIPSNLIGFPVSDLDGTIIGFVSSVTNEDGSVKTQIIGIDKISKMINDAQKNPLTSLSASVLDATEPATNTVKLQ